jgi:hypothetical protein
MAYGTPSGVASYSRTWTRGGVFYDASANPLVAPTKPTLTEVNHWLVQVSAMFDTALKNEGFATPITAVNSLNAITMKVETLVSDLVAYANGLGRLYTDRALERGSMNLLNKEIVDWVKGAITGLENDGVPRTLPASDIVGGFSVAPNRQK